MILSGQILINSRSNNDREEGQVLIAIILYDFKETNSILSNAAITVTCCQHQVIIQVSTKIGQKLLKLNWSPGEYLNPEDLIYRWQFIK